LVHARHCTEFALGWRQVHWGWLFLPWHRAYLFFLERLLADRLGKDGAKFALPYWDWEYHKEIPNTKWRADRKISSPFFGFNLKTDSLNDPDRANLALWDGYRFPSLEKPRMDPNNEPSSSTNTWRKHTQSTLNAIRPSSIKDILGYPEFDVFGGLPLNNPTDSRGQGLLEQLPHNLMHDWVGARYGNYRDMGTLRCASLDPVFNLHHANIDRIWSLYKDNAGQPMLPGDVGNWYQQWFNFRDVDGKMKSVTVEDTVRNMKNVVYREPQEQGPRQTHRTLVAVAATLPKDSPQRGQSITVIDSPKATQGEPITLSAASREKSLATLQTRGSQEPTRSLLVFELGDLQYEGKFYVRVFVNKEDADSRTSIEDEHFVGLFGALDSHAAHGGERPKATTIFRIPLSRSVSNFYKVAPPGKSFTIRLVPVDPSKKFSFTVKKVSLKVY
jgi:polyphenol oxidase